MELLREEFRNHMLMVFSGISGEPLDVAVQVTTVKPCTTDSVSTECCSTESVSTAQEEESGESSCSRVAESSTAPSKKTSFIPRELEDLFRMLGERERQCKDYDSPQPSPIEMIIQLSLLEKLSQDKLYDYTQRM